MSTVTSYTNRKFESTTLNFKPLKVNNIPIGTKTKGTDIIELQFCAPVEESTFTFFIL